MDKLIDVLSDSGPLGILCGVSLLTNVVFAIYANRLLEMLVDSQKERINDALRIHDFIHRLEDVIQICRNTVLTTRSRK